MKIVKILLPISQHGTTAACAEAGLGVAERFGAWLEVLYPCPTPADRLPYATELSPMYFDQLIDVGKKQVSLEKRQAKKWFDKTAKVFPKVARELLTIEGPIARTVPRGQRSLILRYSRASLVKMSRFGRSRETLRCSTLADLFCWCLKRWRERSGRLC
jgi:hypothetical protein